MIASGQDLSSLCKDDGARTFRWTTLHDVILTMKNPQKKWQIIVNARPMYLVDAKSADRLLTCGILSS